MVILMKYLVLNNQIELKKEDLFKVKVKVASNCCNNFKKIN